MKSFTILLLLVLIVSIGCDSGSTTNPAAVNPSSAPTGPQYIVATEPAGGVGVIEALKDSTDGKTVVLVGHVGGSVAPFVDGVAAFSIVDSSIPCCQPEEGCPTPWDYCCTQDQVRTGIATVKIVDSDGKLINEDARKLLGIKELSVVVVQGSARRDVAGNLTVLADKIFIRSHN